MPESTVIYYSSNREDWGFEKRIIKLLLNSCGDLPIVSVTHKAVNLGKNICIGDVGVSGFNMFRQVQIACREAKTRFVILAEADCLYPPDYFTFLPEKDDVFYRNSNLYLMGNKRDYFFRKPEGSTFSQVVNREHYLSILDKLFTGAPDWSAEEKNFPKGRWKIQDVPDKQELYFTENPCVSLKTGQGMRHYSPSERVRIDDIPYWGNGKKLKRRLIYG